MNYWKTYLAVLTLTSGLVFLGTSWRQKALSDLRAAQVPPLPEIIFAPSLKVKGTIISGKVSCYTASNVHATFVMTVQTLAIGMNRNEKPYPQYDIVDVPIILSQTQNFPTISNAWTLGETTIGIGEADLAEYIHTSKTRFVRVKVVAMQGEKDPKFWTSPTSVVRFSEWMPYKPTKPKHK